MKVRDFLELTRQWNTDAEMLTFDPESGNYQPITGAVYDEKEIELHTDCDDCGEEPCALHAKYPPAAAPCAAVADTSQPPAKCGKFAGSLHPRLGLNYACMLQVGHEGECQPGGTCVAHGEYVGATQCPHWPECVALAVPARQPQPADGELVSKFFQMANTASELAKKSNTEIGRLMYTHLINGLDTFSTFSALLESAADRLIQPECPHSPEKKGDIWQCLECGFIWESEPSAAPVAAQGQTQQKENANENETA